MRHTYTSKRELAAVYFYNVITDGKLTALAIRLDQIQVISHEIDQNKWSVSLIGQPNIMWLPEDEGTRLFDAYCKWATGEEDDSDF